MIIPSRPVIGVTADVSDDRATLRMTYARCVAAAGGLAVILPPVPETAEQMLDQCDGIIFSGGDDPIMEPLGCPTHPQAKPIDPQRQTFELALLDLLDQRPQMPVLGVCLGMQLMGLHRGGILDQHLPDTLPTHADHWNKKMHQIAGSLGYGDVNSHHRQALTDAGRLAVVATAHDGVIEAIVDPSRNFYLGVQWHPERTTDPNLGQGLFNRLVTATTRAAHAVSST